MNLDSVEEHLLNIIMLMSHLINFAFLSFLSFIPIIMMVYKQQLQPTRSPSLRDV